MHGYYSEVESFFDPEAAAVVVTVTALVVRDDAIGVEAVVVLAGPVRTVNRNTAAVFRLFQGLGFRIPGIGG